MIDENLDLCLWGWYLLLGKLFLVKISEFVVLVIFFKIVKCNL